MKKFSKMRRLAILMAAAMQAAAIGLAGTAWAAKVAVFNFSFETPAFGVGGFSREFAPGEGWTTVQTGGGLPTNNRFDSGVFRPDIQSVPGELPEGNQAAETGVGRLGIIHNSC
ncbi:MAG: hypothetical protein O3C34_11930, partial [Proteobacteria bacterium]|nr:hypothetical protein [Pseudomonadota bacterium]